MHTHALSHIWTNKPPGWPSRVVHHNCFAGVHGGVSLRVWVLVMPIQVVAERVLSEVTGRDAVWIQHRD